MTDTASIEQPTWLKSGDFTEADEPFRLFDHWFHEAKSSEPRDPNAMSLATVDRDGMPDVRTVLLKGVDARGFTFYTNTESQKGRELAGNPKAALLFYWKSLNRQVRVRGPVERVTSAEADAYFATRPKQAQIGAWASQQSRPLESRFAFEKAIAVYGAKYALGEVPRPPHWSGYRILPISMEFWQDRPVPPARPHRVRPRGAERALGEDADVSVAPRARCPIPATNQPRRTLLLTGASRGIGHATVKRFSAAGWRVITCSRHGFPENCPWEMGPEDHIQVDLADPASTDAAIAEIKTRLEDGELHALVNNAAISPKAEGGKRLGAIDTDARRVDARVPGQFLRADHAGARADGRTDRREGRGGERHLDRGLARASVRRRGLCDLEGGARLADARNGVGLRPARRARQRDRAGRDRHRDPVARAPRRSSRTRFRCTASARPTRSRRPSMCCAPRRRPT